ncbi:Uncharacterized protein OBRU01_26684, partial [Operophtera brumata]
MVQRDKAFWVDKPGSNAYVLHDAFYNYDMATEKVYPVRQDVFPRSYQYDLDCVRYRRQHACDGLKQPEGERTKAVGAHCRDCRKWKEPGLTSFQLAWAKDPGQKRVGRPFQNEACNWYYENYPPVKYDCIVRKFAG